MVITGEHLTIQYISIVLVLSMLKKKIKKLIVKKKIVKNFYRIQPSDLMM